MDNNSSRFRRNNFDVANIVNVTDPASVSDAVVCIFLDLYPHANADILKSAISDISQMYRGEHPDFAPCDTGYHDLQHIMDVTLASARLMDGYERMQSNDKGLGEELFAFGILMALFHDSGYLRKRDSEDHRQGAEFTLIHVARSEDLLKSYLPGAGMGGLSEAAKVVHFTGYEIPIDRIQVSSPAYRMIGNLVASADILAQMSDRCYLEKCYDRLYNEFVLAGIAKRRDGSGHEQVLFSSPQDLVIKTPEFYRGARKRMDDALKGAYHYAEKHFCGQNLYLEAIEKNILFAEYMIAHNADIGMLQRTPPRTPGSDLSSPAANNRRLLVENRRKRNADRRKNQAQRYPELLERRLNPVDRRQDAAAKKKD
jgi:hypothetical protein